jgi:DNA-binding GntR family transcriptional regulator
MYDLATRRTLLADASERRLALDEHVSIFNAIAAHDPTGAAKAMEAHITRSGQVHLRLAFGSRLVEASA